MVLNSDTISFLRHSVQIKFQKESRGFSKEQVQRTLAKLPPLADEIERLQNKLAEFEERALAAEARLVEAQVPTEVVAPAMPTISQDFDETLRNTLVSAQSNADTTIRNAQEEAERLRTEAEFQSNSLLAEAKEQKSEMQKEAEDHRDTLVAEAEGERARLLEAAAAEVKERKDKIEKELVDAHESERANLLEQISDLKGTHNLLQKDVTRFEDHLQSRREDVRKALNEITEVLDDPERLRVEDPIESAEIPDFDADEYAPIGLDVESVTALEEEANLSIETTTQEELIDAEELNALEITEDNDDVDDGASEIVFDSDSIEDFDSTADSFEVEDVEFVEENLEELDEAEKIVPPPPPGSNSGSSAGDPYLEELRRVTTEDPLDGDPITSFLDDDSDKSSGWFGRKK